MKDLLFCLYNVIIIVVIITLVYECITKNIPSVTRVTKYTGMSK